MSSRSNFQKIQPSETLSRDMGLLPVTMIGVGAMIGAGIFVLTGMAAGAAGPALTLSFLLNGFVTIFTAMVYAELGSSFHDAGGGYLWVKEGLPQPNEPKRILVPLGGGPHARLGLELAFDMARYYSSIVDVVTVLPLAASEIEEKKQLELIDAALEGFSVEGIKMQKRVIRDDSVELGLVGASEEFDLMVIGASNIPLWKRLLFGTIPQNVAKHSKTPVIMVKRYEGRVKSWFRKFLSG